MTIEIILYAWGAVKQFATATFLFAAIAWLLKGYIGEKIKARVRAVVDSDLVELKHRLSTGETELASIRSHTLSLKQKRDEIVATKQIEACELIAKKLDELSISAGSVTLLRNIKITAINEKMKDDPAKSIEFIKSFRAGYSTEEPQKVLQEMVTLPSSAKIYTPKVAWSLLEAYSGVIHHAKLTFMMREMGQTTEKILANEALIETITLALPKQKNFLQTNGIQGAYHLTDTLKDKILKEIDNFLSGEEASERELEHAAKVVKAAREFDTEAKRTSYSAMEADK